MSKSGYDSGETTTFQSGPHAMPTLHQDSATLPVIEVSAQSASAEFELGETLGEGGMGQVVSALTLASTTTPLLTFDAKVPAELANICRRAMQHAPADRFESARAVRDAVTAYLRHHEAFELYERTLTKLQEAKDRSPEAARDLKSGYVKIVAVASMSLSVVIQALETSGTVRFTTRDGLVFSLVGLVNAVAYGAWLQRQREANQLQRRIAMSIIGLGVLSGLGWWLAFRDGQRFPSALVVYFLINAAGWWAASVAVEPRGAIVAIGCTLAAVLGMLFPAFAALSGICIGASFWLLSRSLRSSTVA